MAITKLQNGMTIGKAEVIVDIVPKGNVEIRPAYAMTPTEIALHNTGNNGRGADAESHNKYIHNMAKLKPAQTGYASWHLSVDHQHIYQHIPFNETAWHTGDGSGTKSGNMNAIGIEICENSDMTPEQYKQAEENAIALTVYLMKQLGVKISKVKPHQAYSGKHCPRVILNRDGSFDKFHARIEKAYGGNVTVKPAKPVVKGDLVVAKTYLSKGDKGSDVKELQTLLKKAGYDIGNTGADGIFGQDTHEAVMAFQKNNKLAVDGLAGKGTMAKLKEVTTKKATKSYMSKGDKGNNVKELQTLLNKAGYKCGTADGIFGNDTDKAVRAFQKAQKLTVDGKAGASTMAKLKAVANKPKAKKQTVTVLANELWVYNKANWDSKHKTVKKGEVFTIAKTLTVSGSKMYQLSSGLYITANTKFVKVK